MEWFDTVILDWFQSIHSTALTVIMRFFTLLGEGGAVCIVLGLVLLVGRETRKTGMTVLLSLIFSLLVCNLLLKNVVARPRPCWRNPDVTMLIGIPRDYSFPSGHSSASFAAAGSVLLRKHKWALAVIAAAFMTAASRLYFYVHYPTDVLAGAFLGLLFACLAHKIINNMEKRGMFTWEKAKW